MTAAKLPKRVHAEIKRLSSEGDALAESGDDTKALEKYREAWNLIPNPKIDWETSTWLLVAGGDIYFRRKDYPTALDRFLRAIQGPGGLGNPYIHLRLGQLQFEAGDLDRAADELTRAYMGGGLEIFEGADERYLAFLKTRIKPPAGGW